MDLILALEILISKYNLIQKQHAKIPEPHTAVGGGASPTGVGALPPAPVGFFNRHTHTHTHTHLYIYLLHQRSQMYDKVLPRHRLSL